ncbi:aa3-type cytochrome oxidase subunit CtaJ [Kribbella sp. CA-245084]|uniref:aa3-type cytochrome oxidase subunit CtaJ n=1 Tax=Kribbella sp. CA-245084 TaxID=3239940 RepID=UPI003D900C90
MIPQLSGHSLLVFVGIPLLVVAVLALLVFASSIADGPRYRPGLSWWAPPVWINGPTATKPDPANLPELPELTGAPGATVTTATAGTGVARTTGGASASW